ncbi:tRNA threonylcarbamoyladenosine dehydratase [Saccharomycopsis crataegensis]|uniref:tRNA threonylcarbamoyladenosine dehydratase n=1 Tax=Saccharomycopsis crataegensis TaxID=43959 RepID=A0AAV5QR38_9ASCO|nr:tRNA threonylcarbamoyladenosine dehydratase [Saccharomycopsis crataegensis]
MSDNNLRTIGITAIATAALTSVCFELYHQYQARNTKEQFTDSKRSLKRINETIKDYDEDLIQEQLARNYAFLGDEGMAKIRDLYVVVVGAGGVGSWVTTMLVRSGVGKIKVIDFDQVTLSSLNRHAVANLRDVGISKVDTLKNHLLEIAPWVEIEAVNELWTMDNAQRLLLEDGARPDYVIDCIDNIDTKVDLLAYCHDNEVPVISSGGAACKSDPTRMNIGDIRVTEEDALMKSVRRRLKKRGIATGITVAFSAEKPDPRKANLLPLPDDEYEKGKIDELSALQNFRVRILPVLGPMPGMFGLTIVSHLLASVAGYPIEVIEGKNRMKVYDSVLMTLAGQQTRLGKGQVVPISMRDVEYIIEEVFRGKSPISGYSTRLTLSRWLPDRELSTQNVVLMTKEEQKYHEQEVLNGGKRVEDVYSKEVLDLVEKRFKEEEYYSQFR